MPNFSVIEGKLSENYNVYADYDFFNCVATDTRLMGVLAMRITLRSKEAPGSFMTLLLHLDYSEYGIDEYLEYPPDESFNPERSALIDRSWETISGNLGGSYVQLPASAMMYFIDEAMSINALHRADHPEDIRKYQEEVTKRVAQLHKSFDGLVAVGGSYTEDEYMRMVRPRKLSVCETINYFIMRLADCDFSAAAHLSSVNARALEGNPFSAHGITMLMRNSIVHQRKMVDPFGNKRYLCLALTTNETDYYFTTINISLTGRSAQANLTVVSFDVVSTNAISAYEAAMHLKQTEYISVFRPGHLISELSMDSRLFGSLASVSGAANGVVHMVYNRDNSHVDSSTYYMNRDMYGACIFTPSGEMVLMSLSAYNIGEMERTIQRRALPEVLEPVSRYKFDEQIFQTFASTPGALFSDVVDTPDGE